MANTLNDCPSTVSQWKPTGTVASMSMEALLLNSQLETKLDVPSAPSPSDPPTKDREFSAAFHIMFFAKFP
jgi:hypothetical protein